MSSSSLQQCYQDSPTYDSMTVVKNDKSHIYSLATKNNQMSPEKLQRFHFPPEIKIDEHNRRFVRRGHKIYFDNRNDTIAKQKIIIQQLRDERKCMQDKVIQLQSSYKELEKRINYIVKQPKHVHFTDPIEKELSRAGTSEPDVMLIDSQDNSQSIKSMSDSMKKLEQFIFSELEIRCDQLEEKIKHLLIESKQLQNQLIEKDHIINQQYNQIGDIQSYRIQSQDSKKNLPPFFKMDNIDKVLLTDHSDFFSPLNIAQKQIQKPYITMTGKIQLRRKKKRHQCGSMLSPSLNGQVSNSMNMTSMITSPSHHIEQKLRRNKIQTLQNSITQSAVPSQMTIHADGQSLRSKLKMSSIYRSRNFNSKTVTQDPSDLQFQYNRGPNVPLMNSSVVVDSRSSNFQIQDFAKVNHFNIKNSFDISDQRNFVRVQK